MWESVLVAGVVDWAEDPSLSSTELAVLAGVLALAVALVLGYRLYGSFRLSPGERFARVVGSLDTVAVLMHSDPDPDAMASAVAAAEIADERDTDATIYYPRVFSTQVTVCDS